MESIHQDHQHRHNIQLHQLLQLDQMELISMKLVNKVLFQMLQLVTIVDFETQNQINLLNVNVSFFHTFLASDDPQCSTPKRKADGYNQSHLTLAGNTSSMHDDFEMGSPTWPRTPASPVVNSHPEPTPHRSSSKVRFKSLDLLRNCE